MIEARDSKNDKTSLERFTVTPIVFQILERDNKILLILKKQENLWALPGGHMETGETSVSAAIRETKEEVGIDILPDNQSVALAALVKDNTKEGKQRLCVFVKASAWQGEPINNEPDEVSEIKWFALDNLPENIFIATKNGLRDIKAKKNYAEYGF